MADHSEPVKFRENGQFEHQEQRFDVGNGLETDGVHEDHVAGDLVGHRNSSLGKLFVGGVSWETTEANFASYFGNYGEVTDSVIMLDKHSGRPRGFGFVTFADPAVADKVLEEEHVIDGRTVEVKRTVPREATEFKGALRIKKIFVGGLPSSLSNDELREYFSLYGIIVDCQIMLDHQNGRSRGFGFVTFDNEDAVELIFSVGKKHVLGGKQVEIKRAKPKRGGGDYSKSYGGFGDTAAGHDGYNSGSGHYSRKMDRSYGGYGVYGAYGNFGGSYAGFYGGYGGYLYGYGNGGAMYGGAGYGGNANGILGGYGGTSAYSSGTGYGNGAGDSDGVNFGHYGGYDWPGGPMAGRYHPYRK